MNTLSDKYLCRKNDCTGSVDLDLGAFWDYVDIVHFSPVLHSVSPLNLAKESESALATSPGSATKCLHFKFMLIGQQQGLSSHRKRKRIQGDGSGILKKRGQNSSTQTKAKIISQLKVVRGRNTALSKM